MFFCRRKPYRALNKALFSANRSTPEPYVSRRQAQKKAEARRQRPLSFHPFLYHFFRQRPENSRPARAVTFPRPSATNVRPRWTHCTEHRACTTRALLTLRVNRGCAALAARALESARGPQSVDTRPSFANKRKTERRYKAVLRKQKKKQRVEQGFPSHTEAT